MPGGRVWPGVTRALRLFTLYKPVFNGQTTHTQKSKFLLSQAFKWEKSMFIVIPEMPSKTFVMLYKKLLDHFNKSEYFVVFRRRYSSFSWIRSRIQGSGSGAI